MNIWLFLLLTLIISYIYLSNGSSSKSLKQHKKSSKLKSKRFHREPPDVEHGFDEEYSDIWLPDFHDEHHAEVFGHVYTHDDGDPVGASEMRLASELGYDVENCHLCRHYVEEHLDLESEGSGVNDHRDYYYLDDMGDDMGDDIDYYFEVRGRGGSETDEEDYVLVEEDDQDCCSCNCQRRHNHRPPCEREQDGSC